MGVAKDTPFPGVVPANAGTHTPRPRVWAGWLTASAKQHLWLWVPAFAGTTSTALIRSFSFQSTVLANTASRSRRLFRASFAWKALTPQSEGAGNAGRSIRPQPRVQNKNKHTSVVTTVTPETPGIPRAMVLTVSFVLFPGTGLSCPRRQRGAKHHRQLSASVGAPEPHDFTVRDGTARLAAPSASIASRVPRS